MAGCLDERSPDLIEHAVPTLVGQRAFGIALGYEDLIDHDELRYDPALAVLADKLAARRADCAPLAGAAKDMYADAVFSDTNVLIYAKRPLFDHHAVAERALTRLASDGSPLWVSPQILREYLAAVTRP